MSDTKESVEQKNPHGLSKFGESVRELLLEFGLDVASNQQAKKKLLEMCKHVKDVNVLLLIGLALRVGLWLVLLAGVLEYVITGHLASSSGFALAGIALDVQSFTVTAPGAGGTLMAAVSGDPANVRNAVDGSRILLLNAWSFSQLLGNTIIAFPSGNDQTRNINYLNAAGSPYPKIPFGAAQPMRAQDLLSLTQVGSVTAGDVETASLVMYYEDLPGIASALIGLDALMSRMVRLVTVRDTVTPTVASQYSGARALNAATSLLRGNTPYAILGASISVNGGALTVRGPDTGNLRVAMPCLQASDWITARWFVDMAELTGLPCIPTFNSANVSGTFVEVLQNENLAAVPFALLLAELTP